MPMSPEGRIVFDCAFMAVGMGMIIARTVFLRYDNPRMTPTIRMSLVVTNIALWVAAVALCTNFFATIWAMANIIKYRNQTELPLVPYFELPAHLVPRSLKLAFLIKFCYLVGTYMVKGAFLGIFLKFITHVSRTVRVAIKSVIVITIISFLVNILITLLWCRPIQTNWEFGPGLCSAFHTVPVAIIQTVTNVGTDIAIMIIPFLLLKSLKLRTRELWGFAFVFVLGLICVIAAFVRFYFLYSFINDTSGTPPSQNNPIVITSEIEAFVAIVAGCLPSMRAIISKRRSRSKQQASELTDGNSNLPKKMADRDTWSPAIAMKSPPMSPKIFKPTVSTAIYATANPPSRLSPYDYTPPSFVPLKTKNTDARRNSGSGSHDTALSARETEWTVYSQNVGEDEDSSEKGLRTTPSTKW